MTEPAVLSLSLVQPFLTTSRKRDPDARAPDVTGVAAWRLIAG